MSTNQTPVEFPPRVGGIDSLLAEARHKVRVIFARQKRRIKELEAENTKLQGRLAALENPTVQERLVRAQMHFLDTVEKARSIDTSSEDYNRRVQEEGPG